MTIIVGIFDDAGALDRAIEKLADGDFEETVFDQSILAQDVGSDEAFIFAPGTRAAQGVAEAPGKITEANRIAAARVFREHLEEDFHLPDDVIENYAHTFYHDGKFVIVKAKGGQAEQVMEILRGCKASQVNRHD